MITILPTINLICPFDKSLLKKTGETYECSLCNRIYPVVDGVVKILEQADSFYEGTYENILRFLPKSESLRHVWPLWLINSGYPWLVRKYVPAGSIVLELGCAGGVRYLGQRYYMIGCDLSFISLKNIDTYALKLQADAALCIPLPGNSLDAIVSSYFWEHILPETKPAILRECQRVLKPDGKIIFLYDVETNNPLISKYKKADIDRYKLLFIEKDGHLGYEPPTAHRQYFLQNRFEILIQRGMEKTWLQPPSVNSKLAQFGRTANRKFGRLRFLSRSPWFYLYTAILRLVDAIFCPWLPEKWARIEIIVCRKMAP